ncbi:hypothetical protein CLCR_02097 [Cladophialophora carrionii]|uniref:Uncharacterized protein n=1 Tax=Cladophialophora carrionii TaxID=86049 RepID=A0A1C1CDL0_9EURO|nr:hypothetical protein CLCR_02097 [Cladophialophora carrionii]
MCDIEAAKLDGEAVALLLTTGRGWQVLQQDHPDILKLGLYAIRLTACLDQTYRRGPEHLSLKELGILATIFQHDLYELNPILGAGDLSRDPLSNIARLALQIYSDLVLFPAAETYHAKDRLGRELLATLREYFSGRAARFDELKELILWAVVLGAVASDSGYNRDWYLRRMAGLVIQLDLDWDTFKTCMEQFIWWDYMFDDRVRKAWEEAWKLIGERQSMDLSKCSDFPNWRQVVGG